MKWHYTLINADNTNVGETLDPTIQTTQRGVTRMTLMSPLNATNG